VRQLRPRTPALPASWPIAERLSRWLAPLAVHGRRLSATGAQVTAAGGAFLKLAPFWAAGAGDLAPGGVLPKPELASVARLLALVLIGVGTVQPWWPARPGWRWTGFGISFRVRLAAWTTSYSYILSIAAR